jgi:hypothetical protein
MTYEPHLAYTTYRPGYSGCLNILYQEAVEGGGPGPTPSNTQAPYPSDGGGAP